MCVIELNLIRLINQPIIIVTLLVSSCRVVPFLPIVPNSTEYRNKENNNLEAEIVEHPKFQLYQSTQFQFFATEHYHLKK